MHRRGFENFQRAARRFGHDVRRGCRARHFKAAVIHGSHVIRELVSARLNDPVNTCEVAQLAALQRTHEGDDTGDQLARAFGEEGVAFAVQNQPLGERVDVVDEVGITRLWGRSQLVKTGAHIFMRPVLQHTEWIQQIGFSAKRTQLPGNNGEQFGFRIITTSEWPR